MKYKFIDEEIELDFTENEKQLYDEYVAKQKEYEEKWNKKWEKRK